MTDTELKTIDESGKAVVAPAITPMQMLSMAVEQGADIEKLEKLMGLQERWEQNEARKAYVRAMAKFREDCPTIKKDADAHNSKYATLSATLEQIKGLLSECGLSHSWKTTQDGSNLTVTCCVTHIDGHQECTSMTAGPDTTGSKNGIQAIGSTQTYLSRYTLYSVLGLSSREMDNDGATLYEFVSDEQLAELQELACGDMAAFCNYFDAASLAEISKASFERAKKALEKKQKGMK